MIRVSFLLFAAVLFIGSCHQTPMASSPDLNVSPGVYYWKTTLDFTEEDQALSEQLGIKDFYLRYLDVDWSPSLQQAVPVGELSSGYDPELRNYRLENFRIIPTIYITNLTFTKDINTQELAAHIYSAIETINRQLYWNIGADYWSDDDLEQGFSDKYSLVDSIRKETINRIDEIQIDCDWTLSTQAKYFQFLTDFRQLLAEDYWLSCTIRLHQFRDRSQSGIPPVDIGTLMCYNMAPVQEPQTKDAIFDASLLKAYLSKEAYPIPLRAALPVFAWGRAFHENQFRGIISNLREPSSSSSLFTPLAEHNYRLEKDTVLGNIYLRAGDEIRFDAASQDELKAASALLGKREDIEQLIFFDWQADQFRAPAFKSLLNTFYEN